ncbi:MAG: glycine cleavage T C-terminal barrel domain-containing protein, partial [Ginsengibacter sp.]
KLVGIEMLEKGIPRHDYEITDAQGNVIGRVTSGTQSPTLQKPIALGYVHIDFSKIDTPVFIKVREKLIAAKVVKVPFE